MARVLVAVATAGVAAWLSPLAPSAAHAQASFDNALFTLLNQDRASHGVAPVQFSSSISGLAEGSGYGGCGYSIAGRAEDMIRRNYFSHTVLDCGGQTAFTIMRADGVPYTAAAENIGNVNGISDPNAAAQWINSHFMASPDHAGNMLDPTYTTVGIGSWWTAPGQTWSGAGGSPVGNVLVVAEEFTNGPRLAVPAVYHPAPPPPPVHYSVAPAPAPRPAPAAPPPAAAPAASAPSQPDDVLGPPHVPMVTVAGTPVAAEVAPAVRAAQGSAAGMLLAVIVIGLAACLGVRGNLTRGRARRGAHTVPPAG